MSTPKPKPLRTWEQPPQLVAKRWREGGTTWVELECGHVEPATGRDMSQSLRCQQCNPIPRNAFSPQEGWE